MPDAEEPSSPAPTPSEGTTRRPPNWKEGFDALLDRMMRQAQKEWAVTVAELPTESELVCCRTIPGWSQKLGIPEDVIRDRLEEIEPEYFRAPDPANPTILVAVPAYRIDDVCRLCADLLGPPLTDPNAYQ